MHQTSIERVYRQRDFGRNHTIKPLSLHKNKKSTRKFQEINSLVSNKITHRYQTTRVKLYPREPLYLNGLGNCFTGLKRPSCNSNCSLKDAPDLDHNKPSEQTTRTNYPIKHTHANKLLNSGQLDRLHIKQPTNNIVKGIQSQSRTKLKLPADRSPKNKPSDSTQPTPQKIAVTEIQECEDHSCWTRFRDRRGADLRPTEEKSRRREGEGVSVARWCLRSSLLAFPTALRSVASPPFKSRLQARFGMHLGAPFSTYAPIELFLKN